MKKIITLASACLLAFSLSSCVGQLENPRKGANDFNTFYTNATAEDAEKLIAQAYNTYFGGPEEVQKQISDRQMAQTMVDPRQAAAVTANAAANAMQDAANNTAGAMTGFMGMGMAQGMGGGAAAQMYQQGAGQQGAFQQPQSNYPMAEGGGFGGQPFPQPQPQPQPEPQPEPQAAPVAAAAPAADAWICPECDSEQGGNFCSQCGTAKPAPEPEPEVPATWFCTNCGAENNGNFCGQCGKPRP